MLDRHIAMFFIAVLMIGAAVAAFGQDRHDGHAQHHDVYKDWRIPGTASSCCNEKKILPSGETTGDCYPTRYELRRSEDPTVKGVVWWALSDRGRWVEVPYGRIVDEPNPDPTGELGHLCESQVDGRVLCGRPPNTGI